MSRAALYLRVSTKDQHVENQHPELEQMAQRRCPEIVAVYEEKASAVKRRPVFEQMLRDARRRKFDVLFIWAIDRFGRSMFNNIRDVLELDRLGVVVVSASEAWLDTASPVRDLLVAIFSWAAEQERRRLIERTKLGMERARRQGKRIGRKRRYVDLDEARELLAKRMSLRAVARQLGIPHPTLLRAFERERGSKGLTAVPSATP